MAAALAGGDAQIVPLWRDSCLVAGDRPVVLSAAEASRLLAAADEPVFLGFDGGAPVFAADLSALDEEPAVALAGASGVRDVRALVATLTPPQAATFGYARGILHWHRNQRFCGACGGPTTSRQGGSVRACGGCDHLLFPRIEPAVIVLVESDGEPSRCLLGRHRGAPEGSYGTLAGFVEIGESLEDAVRREIAEEAGVRVGPVSYQASQAWPFPAGLMIGFRARALTDAIDVDRDELIEARWFTRPELRTMLARWPLRGDSIESFLIEGWLGDGG
ncbi:NAD(+) diphosphatase [Micromonospora sp. NPDC049679]|uniref:NAD(+) diphosphatase n=1 Tax=Micromonospora sp. NPDC049679 TaxID=3155920 RepID=UPI0033F47DB6